MPRPIFNHDTKQFEFISFQILIAQGIDVNLRDREGRTALHVCLSNLDKPPAELQKLLADKLLKTTDLKLKDKQG